MIPWIIIAIVCLWSLALARRLVELQEDLIIEKRLRWQAEMREERTEQSRRRIAEINWQLITQRPMYFGEMPTANMMYIAEDGRWLEYTHDN